MAYRPEAPRAAIFALMNDSDEADVMFVHGAWVGPRCWDGFAALYDKETVRSVAPSWPFDERPYDALRATPDAGLARVGVAEIVASYEQKLRAMRKQPVLIGHSFGGLIVQLLLDRGLGSAGVAIDSAPPRGIFPRPNAFRASLGVLSAFAGWRRTLTMSREAFSWGFVHELPADQQREAYDAQVIPTPGRPFFQVAFAPFLSVTRVRYDNATRAPLLLIAGERDRTVPWEMNRANHRAYCAHKGAAEITDYQQFPKRSHWIIAEPGWQEVAEKSLAWARSRGALSR